MNLDLSSSSTRTLKNTNLDLNIRTCAQIFQHFLALSCQPNTKIQTRTDSSKNTNTNPATNFPCQPSTKTTNTNPNIGKNTNTNPTTDLSSQPNTKKNKHKPKHHQEYKHKPSNSSSENPQSIFRKPKKLKFKHKPKSDPTHHWNQLTTKPLPFSIHNHQQPLIKPISSKPKRFRIPTRKINQKTH